MTNASSFLGTGWTFPPSFTNRGTIMVSAEKDIHESLIILLSTTPGERVMQPDFGCRLNKHVFGAIDESAIAVIKDAVSKAILFFEPRVTVEQINIDDLDPLQGKILIVVNYKVRSTNNRYNLVYPYYFTEATNVQL
jgi:uncharacterized protein